MDDRLFDEQLVALSERGLIVAPHESKEAFLKRIASLPFFLHEHDFAKLKKLYGISPDWVKLIYSNDDLKFWEGGCTWEEEGRVVIQLRKSFANREHLYAFYSKEELIGHEAVHAVRSPLGSVIFEEMLAYRTAESGLRRWLGPIICKPIESLIYVGTLLLFLLFFAWPVMQLGVFILNIALLFYGMVRLLVTRRKFKEASRRIALLLGGEERVLSFMLHLSDEEILDFSVKSPEEIALYIEEKRERSLHFQQIYMRFLHNRDLA